MMDVKSIQLAKIKVKFNITTLDMVISFIYKESTLKTRKTLNSFLTLFNNLDMSLYNDNIELLDRIWIIITSLQGYLNERCDSSPENLIQFCKDQVDCTDHIKDILNDLPNKKPISFDDSKRLIKKLDDTLQFGYTITVREVMYKLLDGIDDNDVRTYRMVSEDLASIATAIINIKRNASNLVSDQSFSLDAEQFESVVEEAVNRLKDRNRVLQTGLQYLNTMLAPGYQSKRLYIYLAFPGKGKSTILLTSAYHIKKYNKDVKTKDPDKTPCVLFLTLENSTEETIERLWNMAVDNDDIRNYTPRQVASKMKKAGLCITEDNPIDIIIKEYKNREIDTNDIYSIVNDLADDGKEVICIIVDYLKRIRPAEKADNEKTELKNVTNELKDISKYFDVPLISAQQLNRAGAAVVDAALQNNKQDVTRLVGAENIGTAWEIQENADFTCIINPESLPDGSETYLTFKKLKRRYRSIFDGNRSKDIDYFNQPFEVDNNIKLLEDYDLDKPLGVTSLATSFVPTKDEGVHGEVSSTYREHEKKEKKKDKNVIKVNDLNFSPFDLNTSINY